MGTPANRTIWMLFVHGSSYGASLELRHWPGLNCPDNGAVSCEILRSLDQGVIVYCLQTKRRHLPATRMNP
jgi:hypothetical protein